MSHHRGFHHSKGTTAVIHIKDSPPGWDGSDDPHGEHVYIGRPGRFGNPYHLARERQRKGLLRRYRKWLWCRLFHDLDFRDDVALLAGSTLVCYCAPKECHGDVLAAAADWLAAGNVPTKDADGCGLHR